MEQKNQHLPQIILHIGRHKTGTTSIQSFLALNDERLASEYGIYYPEIGRDPRFPYHHPLFMPIVEENRAVDPLHVKAICNEAIKRGCDTILLSSEMLSRSGLSDHQLKLMRDSFPGHEVKLILYFRRQDLFIESRYSEQVKRGLLAAPDTISDIERTSLNYFQFANRYQAVFGKDALIIRSFDKDKAEGLIASFLSIMNVPLTKTFRLPAKTLNTRYPWRYIEVIRRINNVKYARSLVINRYSRFVISKLSSWFPKFMDEPKPLTPEQRNQILEDYQNSNQQLSREYLNEKSLF
ncbi:hypothetical protein [Alteromonas ponticola]|uniref:Sulfotransferase domain-containing protein n=1 Tax=Alteromonas ponticola TaxID=2720613 RepID=A0ABX1QXS0_9ALTE|nr:hypothetical protein [Alteromonas ponticola]NMH59044.1 hypothetical protein [Alteromonas ponticola]